MTDIQQVLEDFLKNSSPEQLKAELEKGYRPLLQKLSDPVLLVTEPMVTVPATVSFFTGEYFASGATREFNPRPCPREAANQELALAA